MKRNNSISVAVVLFISSTVCAETWTPIAGIPAPAFGVTEEPPALPADWKEEVTGFYYVCSDCAGSSDTSFGTPSMPKSSLPSNISSGDVIVVAGSFDAVNLNFACSEDSPCFVIGDEANPPTFFGESELGGSYYIIDGVHFALPSGTSGSTLRIGGSFGAVRNGKVTGNMNAGGTSVGGSNIVILNNEITDNGNVGASGDQDRHGIKVGGQNVWIIGNELARNSGDGVQVGDIGTRDHVFNIYIGRNTSHDNKQTGFWVKEAHDVIVSENVSYGHSPSGSSDGEGMGGQYDPQYVWFLFNEIYDNAAGIGFKSSNNGGGTNFYVIGNYIHDNVGNYDPNDSWSRTAIASWNHADITIVNNTLDGNSGGINLNGNTGATYIYDNAILNMQSAGAKAIFEEDPSDVAFEDKNALDGDTLIDAGMAPLPEKDPYAIFRARYGRGIAQDIEGNQRPIRQWDIGAFESMDEAGPRPNPPVLQAVE